MDAGVIAAPKLSLVEATKVYRAAIGDLVALDRISFDVAAGEIVSLLGPSGCGKTTLLWSMSGLHRLTSGEIRLDGVPVTGPHPDIGLGFREANLLPWRTLDANIRFPFEIKRTQPDAGWIAHLLHRVGLEGFGRRYPHELSGGIQQRAAIVRALALNPSVLLMDEPFGALDGFTREEMNRLVEEIWLDTPTAILFITQSIEEAIFLSDRIVVLSPRPGRVAAVYDVPFARPRTLDVLAGREAFDLTHAIRLDIARGTGARGTGARGPVPAEAKG